MRFVEYRIVWWFSAHISVDGKKVRRYWVRRFVSFRAEERDDFLVEIPNEVIIVRLNKCRAVVVHF
jgi:hypothetical protein